MKKILKYTLLGALAFPVNVMAEDPINNLGDLSLQSLGNIVTSVSKKPEDSFRSAAAVYVITNEDIKLSGATHVAEVLRGVPGLDVAQIDSSDWAISSRGFNGEFSSKLLVLVDGRTIYTPLFSGVYWDIQNMPLEDIARIEVIRGPGASLWGSNAVNGIINIITKNSADTQGTYASTLVGTQDRSITDVRYGGKINDSGYYRVYGKYDDREALPAQGGSSADNAWTNGKTGFRSDITVSNTSKVTVQGDAYQAHINLNLSVPSLTDPSGYNSYHDTLSSKGVNILGKWEEKHSDVLQSTFQAYVDYQSPTYTLLKQQIYTLDFDYQTNWKANERNDVTWGAGAREIATDFTSSDTITIIDQHAGEQIYSAFLQDQIALVQKELYLTLGSKFEQNSYVGFVPEPSARIAWYPDDKQTVWASVSHAVRTPSISERNGNLNAGSVFPGLIAQIQHNPDYTSEVLTAYEVGYRIKPTQKLSIDTTAFINDYSKLETFEPGDLQGGGTILPSTISNFGSGHAYGFETTAKWDVSSHWNLLANYSYINLILDSASSQDPNFMAQQDSAPHNQFMLRSQLFLPHDVQLINTGYYTDQLINRSYNVNQTTNYSVDSYFRFDSQVIWKPLNGLELALVGQNMFDNKHQEFAASLNGQANEIPRAYYAKVTVRY